MPDRIYAHFSGIGGELFASLAIAFVNLAAYLTSDDWDKLLGPLGCLVLSIIMLGVFISHARNRMRREDARNEARERESERRHEDGMKAQKMLYEAHAIKMESFLTQQMAASLEQIKANLRQSSATSEMARSIEKLAFQIQGCQHRKTTETPL
ncbi:MAG: hypothetical protein WCL11_22675 [Verrucomicrobiota bacterium]